MPKKVVKKVKKVKKTEGKPLTVFSVNGGLCMFQLFGTKNSKKIFLSWSINGLDFSVSKDEVKIENLKGKKENLDKCSNFSVSATPTGFVLTYVREDLLVIAKSGDLYNWSIKSEIPKEDSKGGTVVYDKLNDNFVLYRDGVFVKSQMTKTLVSWKSKPSLLFTSRFGMFDSETIRVIGSLPTKEGLLIMYDASAYTKDNILSQIGGVLFDLKDPRRIIWRSSAPLWQGVIDLKKGESLDPIGFVYFQQSFSIYFVTSKNELVISTFPSLFQPSEICEYDILKRFHKNPVIEPRSHHDWEIMGTFNPAVFKDEDGVHLFYRALGGDGISRVGYAKSKDGLTIEKRLPYPVFEPSSGYGLPEAKNAKGPIGYHPGYYTSGGGWGGSEDPRAVKIGDDIYMSYVAFEGWHSVRIALTSISVEDFKAGKWKWRKPVFLSPYGEVHKNWVLFPEKINGKFAVLHSISPKILVDYIDDLKKFDGSIHIKSKAPSGGRETHWDNKMRGAGPPPIKTEKGWLVFYHAHNKSEPHKYKLGAMLLDLKNPTKVLYRSEHPILTPDMHYENEGKPGIVYASGAIINGDDLYIYYGGGDRVVCIATTPLKDFLKYLETGKAESYELKKVYSN